MDCEHTFVLIFRAERKQYIKVNNKRRNFILMRIIYHPDARDFMNKSVAKVKKKTFISSRYSIF